MQEGFPCEIISLSKPEISAAIGCWVTFDPTKSTPWAENVVYCR